jgi:CheY-like chemotaxis protein
MVTKRQRLWQTVGDQVAAVVTDLRMPRMDGWALAQALRRHDPPPPILFISGFNDQRELPGPLLEKPFRPDVFLAAVHQLLEPQRGLNLVQ